MEAHMRSTKRRILAKAAIVLGMVVGGAVGLEPAPASASIGQCTSGGWCYWSSTNFSGTFYRFTGGGNTGTITLRSFYNNGSTGRGVKWYSGTNYSGTYHGCTSTGYGSGNWASTTAPQVEPHGERPVLGQLVT
jgi:hypothetical protein